MDRASLPPEHEAVVYEEILSLARARMRRERPGMTLQSTALANEAWLKLQASGRGFEDRAQFVLAAAGAMKQILIDRARRARGGGPATFIEPAAATGPVDAIDLAEALAQLEEQDPTKAQVVSLRFLIGCTVPETAAALGCSEGKVKKDWAFAKAWLRLRLRGWTEISDES